MLDLGVEPFLLSQGLHMVLAQRLVRKLCPYCKGAKPVTEAQLDKMGEAAEGVTRVYTPTGCRKCLGTGFAGRRAFFEFLRASDDMRDAISRSPSRRELQAPYPPLVRRLIQGLPPVRRRFCALKRSACGRPRTHAARRCPEDPSILACELDAPQLWDILRKQMPLLSNLGECSSLDLSRLVMSRLTSLTARIALARRAPSYPPAL